MTLILSDVVVSRILILLLMVISIFCRYARTVSVGGGVYGGTLSGDP